MSAWLRWVLLAGGALFASLLAWISWRRWGPQAMVSRERATIARIEVDRGRDAALDEIRTRYEGVIESLSEAERRRAEILSVRPDLLVKALIDATVRRQR